MIALTFAADLQLAVRERDRAVYHSIVARRFLTLARLFIVLTWLAIEAAIVAAYVNRGATSVEDSFLTCMGLFDAFVLTSTTFLVVWRAFEIRRHLSATVKINQILICMIPFACGVALALHAVWTIVSGDEMDRYRDFIGDLRVPTAILVSGFLGSFTAILVSGALFLTYSPKKEEGCKTME